jgi:hypothetical protein
MHKVAHLPTYNIDIGAAFVKDAVGFKLKLLQKGIDFAPTENSTPAKWIDIEQNSLVFALLLNRIFIEVCQYEMFGQIDSKNWNVKPLRNNRINDREQ